VIFVRTPRFQVSAFLGQLEKPPSFLRLFLTFFLSPFSLFF
jgi:hypothetical protein